ncbi:MAG: hypothetical protein WC712_05570 [Candidatus Brocadiia bacterium]
MQIPKRPLSGGSSRPMNQIKLTVRPIVTVERGVFIISTRQV